MSTECLFCSIATGEIAANLITSNDMAIAFADINPQAPMHVLVVPRAHLPSVVELAAEPAILAGVMALAAQVGSRAQDGFRLVFNTGPDAGQTVHHVHAHVLAGRNLRWPPG